MNRGQLVTRVGQKLGMAWDVAGEEQTLLRDWVNEGIIDVLYNTHIYIAIGEMQLTPGCAEVRLDPSILAIDDGRGSTPAGIGHYRLAGLDEIISRQSANVVSSTYQKVIAIEGDLMIISPTPDTSEVLRFYYVPKPSPTSDDAHDPSTPVYGGIPAVHHNTLEYYMLWQGSEYDDKEHALKPKDYHDIYAAKCKEIRVRRRGLRSRYLIEPRIGYPSTRSGVPRRNDQYPAR